MNSSLRFRAPERVTKVRFFRTPAELRRFAASQSCQFIYDRGVPARFALGGARGLRLPPGERGKNWRALERALGFLAAQSVERGTRLCVQGGGAACDLGALTASLYRRGMPLVLVPTTLLAMVDAAVGGKTAVDLTSGTRVIQKNFAGTFYPAEEVWICFEYLRTLPKRERVSGAGELVKMLWVAGKRVPWRAVLAFVHAGDIDSAFSAAVKTAIGAKIKVVARDPMDTRRVREVLNFGHTAGHVLETAARGKLSHGEAILWGMALETALLPRQKKFMGEILSALAVFGLDELPVRLNSSQWTQMLGADKKIRGGKVEMSVLAAPGKIVRAKFSRAELAARWSKFSS